MKRNASLIVALASVLLIAGAPAEAADSMQMESQDGIALAQAFTAALNDHDVDTVVAMFNYEDAGPTLTAEDSASQKFEIRRWAEDQVLANIIIDGYAYRVTSNGASWYATVHRDDWQALGADPVLVADSLVVQNGQLENFTSRLRNPVDARMLVSVWRTQPDCADIVLGVDDRASDDEIRDSYQCLGGRMLNGGDADAWVRFVRSQPRVTFLRMFLYGNVFEREIPAGTVVVFGASDGTDYTVYLDKNGKVVEIE
jgi:hypothetical protein